MNPLAWLVAIVAWILSKIFRGPKTVALRLRTYRDMRREGWSREDARAEASRAQLHDGRLH